MDTIFALSSGLVPSGVAVIRISGPLAGAVLDRLCGGRPEPRVAALRTLRDASGEPVDRGMALWFPAPASFTGEDVAELQAHGSRAVLAALFDSLAEQGLRPAEAGEFARRALFNGKMDLAEAEGLADLIAADTEAQRRQALGQAGGALSRSCQAWREEAIALRAEVEARLDFPDEGDVAEALPAGFAKRAATLRLAIEQAVASDVGERLREGCRIAILGRPNAGKSSLLNRLARRDVAIATPEPGTTRDVLEVALDLGGYPAVVMDTAGLRESDSLAEQAGVARARQAAETADLVLWLSDLSEEEPDVPLLPKEDEPPTWRIGTKSDLVEEPGAGCDLVISSLTAEGLDALEARLADFVRRRLGGGDVAVVTRARQRVALADAARHLRRAEQGAERSGGEEIVAENLRLAADAIGRVSGKVDVEDVLDIVFSEFCIGK